MNIKTRVSLLRILLDVVTTTDTDQLQPFGQWVGERDHELTKLQYASQSLSVQDEKAHKISAIFAVLS